ncbi:MAG: DNA-processing protein DprA, partial [Candidatus Pacearchaeota archaeon]|nr:DNA-processing protein DprA [Candidatus Pacearchaeota archaeon]
FFFCFMVNIGKRDALYHLVLMHEGLSNEEIRSPIVNSWRRGFQSVCNMLFEGKNITKMEFLESLNENFRQSVYAIYREDFHTIRVNDVNFPKCLRQSSCSAIYTKGDNELLRAPTISVNGSYNAEEKLEPSKWEEYQKEVIGSVIGLVKKGFTIVSEVYGDTHRIALNTALKYGGSAIGIVKGGLDAHVEETLKPRLLKKGLLVSDMPVGMRYLWDFSAFNSRRLSSNIEMYLSNFGTQRFSIHDDGEFYSNFYSRNPESEEFEEF